MRYRPDSQLQSMVKALPEGIDVSLEDIDYTHIEDGRAKWRLVSHQVERQSAAGVLNVKNPELSFFDEQGQVDGSLRAGVGNVSSDYKVVHLMNDVILDHSSGYLLKTDQMNYDHATQTVTTDSKVFVTADDMRLQGTGLVFYLKEERLILSSDVKGFFDTEK